MDPISLGFLVLVFGAAYWFLHSVFQWCVDDGELRGVRPGAVFVAVFFFFPLGWLAWLMLRPAVVRSETGARFYQGL